jgi:hypothetical protein
MENLRGPGLACAFVDEEGDLAEAIEALRPQLAARFGHVALRIDEKTDPRTVEAAWSIGARTTIAPRSFAEVGRARRHAVADARAAGARTVVAGDLDHILRWLRDAPAELDEALAVAEGVDCLVVGRGPGALEASPAPLRETERLVNLAYERLTGNAWDLLSSVRVLSAAGADAVVGRSTVDTIATDVDWPLRCAADGLRVGYHVGAHLTYREGNRLGAGPADPSDPGAARAWLGRLRICGWMSEAMAAYLPEG